ncbi:MAG: tail fiber protein [Vicinamibacteria bacterium]
MAQPYVGEIRMFAGNFAPAGWQFCDGSLLPISEYETLFNLIGTTFGGDGQSTFAMPDLRGRVPIHQGNSFILGETGGAESVTLTVQQIPVHNHALMATVNLANATTPQGNVLAQTNVAGVQQYFPAPGNQPLAANAITATGGSQPHDNMQPYLCVSFIISLFGIFPSPS